MEMQYLVNGTAGETADIIDCVGNIMKIPEGSIPLARGLGIPWNMLSEIPPDMQSDFAVAAVEKVEEYEPRAAVSEVRFSASPEDGSMRATIVLDVEENGNGE